MSIVRKSSFALLLNGVSQFGLGAVGLANQVCLKTPGMLLNEGANLLEAGVSKLSSDAESKFIKYKKSKSYASHLADTAKSDARMKLYLRGAIPLSEIPIIASVSERIDFLKETLKESGNKQSDVDTDTTDVFVDSDGEIIIIK